MPRPLYPQKRFQVRRRLDVALCSVAYMMNTSRMALHRESERSWANSEGMHVSNK